MLLEAGAAILGIAFLVKAGMWPLGFWLPSAYTAAARPGRRDVRHPDQGRHLRAAAPVAAALRRASRRRPPVSAARCCCSAAWRRSPSARSACSPRRRWAGSPASACWSPPARCSPRSAWADAAVTAGALFYLVSSTLTIGAFFLLIELVERGAGRQPRRARRHRGSLRRRMTKSDEEDEEVGVAIPGTLAVLGLCFVACALLLAGLPPLSGFVAKFAMLAAMLNPERARAGRRRSRRYRGCLSRCSSCPACAALIAMMRAGIRTFWTPVEAVAAARAARRDRAGGRPCSP